MAADEGEDPQDAAAPDLDRLLEPHLSGLRAFVRLRSNRRVRAHESASDLVQSVCRELIEAESFEYRDEAQFRGWLYTAALRKIIQRDRYLTREVRDADRNVSGGDEEAEQALLEQYATITTPSMHASAKEQLSAIEAAFDTLTEDQREVLTLARIAKLSHAEIAERTGRSEEACRQLLRARADPALHGFGVDSSRSLGRGRGFSSLFRIARVTERAE